MRSWWIGLGSLAAGLLAALALTGPPASAASCSTTTVYQKVCSSAPMTTRRCQTVTRRSCTPITVPVRSCQTTTSWQTRCTRVFLGRRWTTRCAAEPATRTYCTTTDQQQLACRTTTQTACTSVSTLQTSCRLTPVTQTSCPSDLSSLSGNGQSGRSSGASRPASCTAPPRTVPNVCLGSGGSAYAYETFNGCTGALITHGPVVSDSACKAGTLNSTGNAVLPNGAGSGTRSCPNPGDWRANRTFVGCVETQCGVGEFAHVNACGETMGNTWTQADGACTGPTIAGCHGIVGQVNAGVSEQYSPACQPKAGYRALVITACSTTRLHYGSGYYTNSCGSVIPGSAFTNRYVGPYNCLWVPDSPSKPKPHCKSGFTYDSQTGQCVKIPTPHCAHGFTYDSQTGQCVRGGSICTTLPQPSTQITEGTPTPTGCAGAGLYTTSAPLTTTVTTWACVNGVPTPSTSTQTTTVTGTAPTTTDCQPTTVVTGSTFRACVGGRAVGQAYVTYTDAHCLTFEGGTVDCQPGGTYSGTTTQGPFTEPVYDPAHCPVPIPIPQPLTLRGTDWTPPSGVASGQAPGCRTVTACWRAHDPHACRTLTVCHG